MKKFKFVIAAVLLVCLVFSVACSKGTENNFGKELLTVKSQLDALNGLKKQTKNASAS